MLEFAKEGNKSLWVCCGSCKEVEKLESLWRLLVVGMGSEVEEKGEGVVDLASNGDEERQSSVVDSDSSPSAWLTVDNDNDANSYSSPDVVGVGQEEKTELIKDRKKSEKEGSKLSDSTETDMMKERFAKLLLGEDMSGCGKGVCTALSISNAITNLGATLFGQLWRLEPLPSEKKLMWRREMEWLLCVSDHIVELVPNWQTFPDGSKLEVMTCRQRSDLFINLPALRKLDSMLLEILDSFSNTEFWYLDQGILPPDSDGVTSSNHSTHRQDEKWWLPVPHVPCEGLQEITKKNLLHKRECANQIHKASMAINDNALAEMEIPDSYLETLPKHGRTNLGDVIRKHITSEQFSPEHLLDCLDLSSEHQALEIANRVESSINVWHRTAHFKHHNHLPRHTHHHMPSWGMVRELMLDGDHKRELLAERAESLLICLKHRFPGLPQTALETSKIQYNQDVGKSILESYSRVLESIASNIVARIDDLLYVDDLTRYSDNLTSMTKVSIVSQIKRVPVSCLPASTSPYATGFAPHGFSPSLT